MQVVLHEYRNKSRIFTMLESLYAYVSDRDKFEGMIWLDDSFTELNTILQEYLLLYRNPVIKHFDFPQLEYKHYTRKEVTVCLSGGKDSAACAYYYKKLGYKVHLYHATGVNKAYGDEKSAATKIAKYLGCDLFIDKVRLEGTHSFIEHPMKNYIIANGAIHYCIERGYSPVIAFGNFNKSALSDNSFEVCGGDCMEMWDAYKPIIRRVLPDFNILVPLETNADTFSILNEDWHLFELSVSCMSPFRFRAFWKHRCEEQYNIRLFENRCGVCWKCCIEAMWLMDTGKMSYSEPYYAHCVGILVSTIKKEFDFIPTYEEVWDNYMWYPITMSKLFNVYKDLTFKYYLGGSTHVFLKGERFDAPVHTNEAKITK